MLPTGIIDHFERDVPEEHRFQVLHLALRATPVRWWEPTRITLLIGSNIID